MPPVIDIQAAGTAMRFMTAYLSVTPGEHTITGTERMRHRPIGLLVDALRMLGADISYTGEQGYPPLHICGNKLPGGKLEIPGNISSQFISALLLIGPMMHLGLTLHLTGEIVSRPYIDLTLWVMKSYGADVDWTGTDTIEVKPKPYVDRPYLIENDWSAASYWYEMAALYPENEVRVTLDGLMNGSRQGDSVVRYIYSLLGVRTQFSEPHSNQPTVVKAVTPCRPRRQPHLRLHQLPRPGADRGVHLLCAQRPLHVHRSEQPAHQRDRQTGGTSERVAQIGIHY